MKRTITQNQDGLTIISNKKEAQTYLGKDNPKEPTPKAEKPISKAEERRRKKAEKLAKEAATMAMVNDFLYGKRNVIDGDSLNESKPQTTMCDTKVTTMGKIDEFSREVAESKGQESSYNTNTAIPESQVAPVSVSDVMEEQREPIISENTSLSNTDDGMNSCNIVNEVIATTEMTDVIKVERVNENSPLESSTKEAPSPKSTRVSAKIRKKSRGEFCVTYLQKCDTKFGKPITIEKNLMTILYRLCMLTGDRNACPTYLINNLLKEILPQWEEQSKEWKGLD